MRSFYKTVATNPSMMVLWNRFSHGFPWPPWLIFCCFRCFWWFVLVFHGFPCFRNVFSCSFMFFPSVFLELSLYKMENMGRTLGGSHYKMENLGRTLGGDPLQNHKHGLQNGGARNLQRNPSLGFCRGAHFPFAHVFHFVVAAFGNKWKSARVDVM